MNINETKHELQNILSGKSSSSHDALIQTIASYLRRSKKTSFVVERKFKDKEEEKKKLIDFAQQNNLVHTNINESNYISSGAEQTVYIKNSQQVIKLNDTIYYEPWLDYFHNLLLNNYFFADTRYQFSGFYLSEKDLYAIVQQNFIKANEPTNLKKVKEFLLSNGFTNTRNHDYFHPELGIILEDLHDENVLTNDGVLYFIDTVFYIKPETFWN